MNKFIVFLTFIPWFLYFASLCKTAIKDLKDNKVTMKWIKDNFFKIFHFENLLLIAIFVYFSINYYKASQIWLVDVLLFSSINLYLFINRYYDKNRKEGIIGNNDIITILILILLCTIPVTFFFTTNRLAITYYILFGLSFFNYLVVYLSKTINKLVLKLVKKHNDSLK